MYCVRNVTKDLLWVGGNDRRLSLFEGFYPVPKGMSYNAYLLLDEKTVLFDTVDKAAAGQLFENLAYGLQGRALDYLVIHHMEPDHSATVEELLLRYPETKILCNNKIAVMLGQYFSMDLKSRLTVVDEKTEFCSGVHSFRFVMAPMVHWPEVMVSFDVTEGILFSADAFGTFGALNGALFADETDFENELSEYRRYYTNICGKYGPQVLSLLKKASALPIQTICPLHGPVWRKDLGRIIDKYLLWAAYEPEKPGVLVAYASVYGHTSNAAEILCCKLNELGVRTELFDTSMTHPSYILSAAFANKALVFASTTYNAGVFVTMENLLRELVAHNLQNRTAAFIENGSWAPVSGKQMRELLSPCKNIRCLDETVVIRSALKEEQQPSLNALAQALQAAL